MGGSSSNGGGSSTTRMKTEYEVEAEKQARERQKMAQSGVQDPEDFTRLAENLQAQKLEREAETQDFLGRPRSETIKIGSFDTRVPKSGVSILGMGLTKVREFALKQQARELRRGGSIVTDKETGDYVGVMRDGIYSGRAEFDPNRQKEDSGSDPQSAVVGEVTPEITPEVVPDETIITAQSNLPRGRRGTQRTRRAGQAGTLIEGYGVLTRPAGKRSVV